MRYTTLRVKERGVVLYDLHVARLAAEGERGLRAFDDFARAAAPGVYGVRVADGGLEASVLGGSRLEDGQPVRFAVSPFAGRWGGFPKPGPPSPYDRVRLPGVATLLTSADGSEIYESCVAAVLGWDGAGFVCVPEDRPRVASVAEAAVRAAATFTTAPLAVAGRSPLVLLNAVAGPCVVATGRPAPPEEALGILRDILDRSTRRP